MAYTAKYASAFYGPFRDALASAPKPGELLAPSAPWRSQGSLDAMPRAMDLWAALPTSCCRAGGPRLLALSCTVPSKDQAATY